MHELEPAPPNLPFQTAQKPTLQRIFFGSDGLRAGWSLLLFIIFFSLLVPSGTYLVHRLLSHPNAVSAAPRELVPGTVILGQGIALLALGIAALLMSRVERRRFSVYGLAAPRMPADFALGLCWGITALSLLVGILFLTHTLAFDSVALHGLPALTYAAEWAGVFLLVGLFEEFFFRGYFQYTLARGIAGLTRALRPESPHAHLIGFWAAAALLSGVLFTVAHLGNHGETIEGIFSVAIAGTVFAFSLYRTGSLWWAIGFHTAWDWGQSYLYGTPDSGTLARGHLLVTHPMGRTLLSGGSAGPEGSILLIPVFLLVAAVIHVTLPRRIHPLPLHQTNDLSPLSTFTPELTSSSRPDVTHLD